MQRITKRHIENFKTHLADDEKSTATFEKYLRDVSVFMKWMAGKSLDKDTVLQYKRRLIENYAPASVNSVISSLNSFFICNGRHDLKLKSVKIQKQIFAHKNKELTCNEYKRLLYAARRQNDSRLFYLMQTICSCGLRISELKFITTEAVRNEQATINCKGKMRIVILPKQLCKMLALYVKKNKIKSGPVFVSKNGLPLDRSNIWTAMKKLCESANVSKDKVFPHNLRHLFARTYYSLKKDVVRLADILGHSSVDTTRIYTMESGDVHRRQIQQLGLLLC